ncbi:MAG: hypothetical protein IPH50_14300 [Rhodanobacteraceae bacterium]|nr:hypothetical protein [Rhodanobacteraceae bacterium]
MNLTLSNPIGGASSGAPNTAVLTITDDDPPPAAGSLQFAVAASAVAENGATATISVTRTGGSTGAVSIDYASSNGSATAGSDYTATSGTLNWAAGDTTPQTFTVAITDDATDEPDETVNLTLSNPTGGASSGAPNTAVLTITDNDPPPAAGSLQFAVAASAVAENGATATISVTRTGGSTGAVSIDYASSNGSAAAGSDYTAASGTLNWANGDTTPQTFTVTITDDATDEPDETVNLTLSNPIGGASSGAPNTAVLTITDDDPPPAAGSAAICGRGLGGCRERRDGDDQRDAYRRQHRCGEHRLRQQQRQCDGGQRLHRHQRHVELGRRRHHAADLHRRDHR